MAESFVSPASHHRRSLFRSKNRVIEQKPPTESLQNWRFSADRCGTPAQFRELLDHLKILVPFQHVMCVWGSPSRHTIRFVFNHGYPNELLRWYLTKGMLWRGPLFREWLRTGRSQISCDVWRRLVKRIDSEYLQQVKKYHLTGLLAGGVKRRGFSIFVVMHMGSDQSCRSYLKDFELIVPVLAKALQRACPRPLLTEREIVILEQRMMGKIPKEIAVAEAIREGTVREHLQTIKRKLFTNDLVNAVVIAMRTGLLVHAPTR